MFGITGWVVTQYVNGAPECMRIYGFMHDITNPNLIKKLNDNIPKSVDEMINVTTAFLKGEVGAANQSRKKIQPWRNHETNHKPNFDKRLDFKSQHKEAARPGSHLSQKPKGNSGNGDNKVQSTATIEAEGEGHLIHCMYVDGGSASVSEFGFGSRWRNWIRECLSSVRLSILINGSPTDKISMYRGLRQGDPLSPFLFIFVMKELHLSIQKVVEDKRITRASVGENNINISHLFFADDVVFLSEWNARGKVRWYVYHVLNDFHTQSGLKINIGKSNLYGVGTNTQDVRNMARASGCADGSLSFSYLDTKGAVFGGLVEASLRPSTKKIYQGSNNTFGFTNASGPPVIFRPTGSNRYFTLCSTEYLALGGGSHFALYLDSDLLCCEFVSGSIRSLGKSGTCNQVYDRSVHEASLSNAKSGLRIKTWQGGTGFVRNVEYENVWMMNVSRPIIFDQYYCESSKAYPNKGFGFCFVEFEVPEAVQKAIEGKLTSLTRTKGSSQKSNGCFMILCDYGPTSPYYKYPLESLTLLFYKNLMSYMGIGVITAKYADYGFILFTLLQVPIGISYIAILYESYELYGHWGHYRLIVKALVDCVMDAKRLMANYDWDMCMHKLKRAVGCDTMSGDLKLARVETTDVANVVLNDKLWLAWEKYSQTSSLKTSCNICAFASGMREKGNKSNDEYKSLEIARLEKKVQSLALELDAAKLATVNECNKNAA
ncbi:reverse transcriptase domain, reverse transcriptase zinc-binding domain protein [Tanacetum coccineum]